MPFKERHFPNALQKKQSPASKRVIQTLTCEWNNCILTLISLKRYETFSGQSILISAAKHFQCICHMVKTMRLWQTLDCITLPVEGWYWPRIHITKKQNKLLMTAFPTKAGLHITVNARLYPFTGHISNLTLQVSFSSTLPPNSASANYAAEGGTLYLTASVHPHCQHPPKGGLLTWLWIQHSNEVLT